MEFKMASLLATEPAEVTTGIMGLPPHFGIMLIAVTIVFGLSLILFTLGWRVIDWITPGKLDDEIVPKDPIKRPNIALAIIVSAMIVGLSIVLGCTIVGVMVH
jgi:hypothetical protein